jgi:membrane-bound lytic murein transglycosylase F
MANARMYILLATAALLAGCEQPTVLERIQAAGELVVATRLGPSTYYDGAAGPAGLEYDLVTRFAEDLGVRVRFVQPRPLARLLSKVRRGAVHMAAAGLVATPGRARALRFSQPYLTATQQLVYRRGNRRPKSLDDLGDGVLEVVAGSAHEETLRALQSTGFGQLRWSASPAHTSVELLTKVNDAQLDYTIINSNELTLNRRFYAHVTPALQLSDPQPVAWAFPAWTDPSLVDAANAFLTRLEQDGTLSRLRQHYYDHADRLNFVDKRQFWRHVADRLPAYRPYFEEAAALVELDWRLLAAVGYQESHWDPEAVSPTGVRGVMMLTRDTAKQVGVDDRLDARASILGGAQYLRQIEGRLPERIPEPDRLWLTLAGYNIGFGHLEDARVLTQRQGANPDRWADVKQRLPLLSKKAYHRTLKHGYARGQEPVDYVENIRNFYDLLVWQTNNFQREAQRAAAGLGAGS